MDAKLEGFERYYARGPRLFQTDICLELCQDEKGRENS